MIKRGAMLAIGLLVGLAGTSVAATTGAGGNTAMVIAQADNAPQSTAQTKPVAAPSQVVAPDQLNEVDRAAPSATEAADPPAARGAPVTAGSGEHSLWDETSLIGKIFIGFGTVLTLASAARMFMA